LDRARRAHGCPGGEGQNWGVGSVTPTHRARGRRGKCRGHHAHERNGPRTGPSVWFGKVGGASAPPGFGDLHGVVSPAACTVVEGLLARRRRRRSGGSRPGGHRRSGPATWKKSTAGRFVRYARSKEVTPWTFPAAAVCCHWWA